MTQPEKLETSKALGYRMPAEWEPQEAVWLSWPHNELTFGEFMDKVRTSYAKFASEVSKGQKVKMLVSPENKESAIEYLKNNDTNMGNVIFYEFSPEDVWIRDYGPTFVINKEAEKPLAMVIWTFNAWGDKYDDLIRDREIPYKMIEVMDVKTFKTGINMEGGSFDVNGKGVVLTTEQCLLNKNRNPTYTKEGLEKVLCDYLNLEKVIWLKEGVLGDDTDGHIDDVARFVSPDTIVCAYEDNVDDPNHPILDENYKLLLEEKNLDGKPFRVVKIPMPDPVKDEEDTYLPASYINFYIANEVVVVPTFGCEKDDMALSILQKEFPNRRVVGVDCKEFVYGLGTLHCSSQQEPKV